MFETQAKDFWLFEEQLQRWQIGPFSAGQCQEVECLVGQMCALRENNEQVLVLVLARELV